MERKLLEELTCFGLSRQEASIYVELIKHGKMTGYELSKETGISRSNVYAACAELVSKGACYLEEVESTKYIPVDLEIFLKNRINRLKEKADFIVAHKPAEVVNADGYITIRGSENIMDKVKQMIGCTSARIYLLASSKIIENFESELISLAKRNIKIVILSDGFNMGNAKIYKTEVEPDQIRFISDSTFVLTGQLSGSVEDKCLYSGQENLVSVMKEYLKNKIFLLENNL
nr:helix-turn-helix domain-containing protein [uncultured Treponema sp.]